MTSDSDVGMEELERRLRGGDLQALAEVFTRERDRLWQIIHFRLPNRCEEGWGLTTCCKKLFWPPVSA